MFCDASQKPNCLKRIYADVKHSTINRDVNLKKNNINPDRARTEIQAESLTNILRKNFVCLLYVSHIHTFK